MTYHFSVTVDNYGLVHIEEPSTLLQAIIVPKGQSFRLREGEDFDNWAVTGCYLLDHGNGRLYVGRSDSLIDRLESHERHKDFTRALLIRRSHFKNFSHGATEWLEEAIFRTLSDQGLKWSNQIVPKGWQMSSLEQDALRQFLPIIHSLACILGINLANQNSVSVQDFSLTNVKTKIQLIDLIHAGLVKVDEILYPPQGTNYPTAIVTSNGKLIINGKTFNYLSHACKFISNNNLRNGWKAWYIKTSTGEFVALDVLRRKLVNNS